MCGCLPADALPSIIDSLLFAELAAVAKASKEDDQGSARGSDDDDDDPAGILTIDNLNEVKQKEN